MRGTWGVPVFCIFGCASTTVATAPDAGGCGVHSVVDGASVTSPTPRLIAPLSTATVTSQTPTLHWALATESDGAHLEICRDRACGTVEQTLDVTGTRTTVPTALTPGVHFWRSAARTGTTVEAAWSPTWEFFVGHRSAPVDTSWGTVADFNGDGFADVVVGAGYFNTIYVYLGSASGPGATPIMLTGPACDCPGVTDFGGSVASAGDVNGDGFADLVVGNQYADAAYVYLGSPSGLSTIPLTLSGSIASYFGLSVASAGDVNGDGFADVVAATAPVDDQAYAYVYLGSASGLDATPIELGAGRDCNASSVASAGDITGDGCADVVVGGTVCCSDGLIGCAYLYVGSASGLQTTPTPAIGIRGPISGGSVASAGDVNGDGLADLVLERKGDNAAMV